MTGSNCQWPRHVGRSGLRLDFEPHEDGLLPQIGSVRAAGQAAAFARQNGVNLLDVNGLLGLIARRTPEEQAALLAVALEGDYWQPTCVYCGVKLVSRLPRTGGSAFWGCTQVHDDHGDTPGPRACQSLPAMHTGARGAN